MLASVTLYDNSRLYLDLGESSFFIWITLKDAVLWQKRTSYGEKKRKNVKREKKLKKEYLDPWHIRQIDISYWIPCH